MSFSLSGWVGSIAVSCLISGAALAVTPKGKVQRILKTVCGILVVVAVVSPLISLRDADVSLDMESYREKSQELTGAAQEQNGNLCGDIIAGQLEEYILDKAETLGVPLTSADVVTETDDSGVTVPVSVTLTGDATEAQKKKLSALVESELGISADCQKWSAQ